MIEHWLKTSLQEASRPPLRRARARHKNRPKISTGRAVLVETAGQAVTVPSPVDVSGCSRGSTARRYAARLRGSHATVRTRITARLMSHRYIDARGGGHGVSAVQPTLAQPWGAVRRREGLRTADRRQQPAARGEQDIDARAYTRQQP